MNLPRCTVNILLHAAVTTLCALPSSAAQGPTRPIAPSNLQAIPDYGNNSITLTWTDNSNNELLFVIFRKEDAGDYNAIAQVGRNVTTYTDPGLAANTEYFYKVRAAGLAGPSPLSSAARQNFRTLWPVPASHEILHNWNETIGVAGVDETGTATGFHMGVDIQRTGNANNILAVRGGRVVDVRQAAAGPNGVVVVRVKEGADHVLYQTNHVDRGVVAVGDAVFAGQKLAEISQRIRWPGGATFVDHTHFVLTDEAYHTLQQHPLAIFSRAADKDPQELGPELNDHAGTPAGFLLAQRQGAAAGVYLGPVLDGDVDLIVELRDRLGTNPDQVPTKLSYWIQPPAATCAVTYHGVRTAPKPYVLFSWAAEYFGDLVTPLALLGRVVDLARNHGPSIVDSTQTYPWPNYKHFIVTNTGTESGFAGDVDAGEYWNTNAKDDGSADDVAHANFTGKPDTNRARMARFPDGTYTLHVLASDLVHSDVDRTLALRIDNFCPIVCRSEPQGRLPLGTTTAQGLVEFNEPMDTSMTPFPQVSVDNGATISNVSWFGDRTLVFQLDQLAPTETYTIRVDGNQVMDLPPLPGGRLLDGNEDGACGDDFVTTFEVAGCFTLDFELEDDFDTPLDNGQSVSTPPEFGNLVSISSSGPNAGAAIFDSTPGGPNDPSQNDDMLIGHGNLLLLQDDQYSAQTVPDVWDVVTDDPNGGDLIFDFVSPVDPRGILLADINPPPNLGASVTLVDEDNLTRVYTVEPGWTGTYGNAGPHRLDLTTLAPQPGNGTPRFATASESPGFQQDRVVRIVVHLTGYGAIDELEFCR